MPLTTSHWGTFRAEWTQGKVAGLKPFEHDPDPSPIVAGLSELYDHRTRVRRPSVRRSWLDHGPGARTHLRGREPFVEVGWPEALDLIAAELQRIRSQFGNPAIFGGSYGWASAGRFHHAKTQLKRFLNHFGGSTEQVNNYSYGAAAVLLPHVVGDIGYLSGQATSWRSIAENTELFLAFGGTPWKNSQVEAGGCGKHVHRHWTGEAAAARMRTVNISPLRDDASDWQDAEWWPIRPGTDTALLLALAHTLLVEKLHDVEFLASHCVGFEPFAAYLLEGRPGGFNADWAAGICQLDAEAIRRLARETVRKRTMISLSWSIQRADYGEQPYWAAIALAAMIGQLGLPGGGVGFGYGATNGVGTVGANVRSVNLDAPKNPTGRTIPVARVADLLLEPGRVIKYNGGLVEFPDIKLVYWVGGNPFHHHQDINRLVQAWRRPETIIVHEISWTSTARFSDIVLPATTTLERDDIGSSSRDRFLVAMKKVAEPYAEARDDFAIFRDLARRVGIEAEFSEGRDEQQWLEHLYEAARQGNLARGFEVPAFRDFWNDGYFEFPERATPLVALQAFREDPHSAPLATPSGRIEITSETLASFDMPDCGAHPRWFEPREWLGARLAEAYPLHLISNQPKTRLHSQLDMLGVSMASKIKGREPLRINPADARSRGIQEGDVVRVYNGRGACLAGIEISDAVRPSVVQLSTGAWYDPKPDLGDIDVHGNPNVLTHDLGTSSLSCGPSTQSVLVQVEAYYGPLPEITVGDPPNFVPR